MKSRSQPPREPRSRLPEVVRVEATRVRFPEPRTYFFGREEREVRQAVELMVETSASLPVMDLPPILYVGETPVPEYEPVAPRRYRFTAYEPERLEEGAVISIGWPNAPQRKVETRFRYQPGGPPLA